METAPVEICETFFEKITTQSTEGLLTRMTEHAYHGAERVRLVVSSPGGEVASAIALHEGLRSLPIEFITYNTGEVASMGNIMFLAGDERLASAEATFLLHPITLLTPTGWPTAAPWLDVEDMRKLRTKVERSGAHPFAILMELAGRVVQ
jgi:ATP-dependent protease ClpP protease subunit